MNKRKLIAKNKYLSFDFIVNLLSLIIGGICLIIVNYLIQLYRGPEILGFYSQSLAIFVILSQLSTFGIQFSTLKHISFNKTSPKKCDEILISATIAVFFISIIAGFSLFSSRFYLSELFNSPSLSKSILIVIPSIILFSMPSPI